MYRLNWNLESWFLWRVENQKTPIKALGEGTRSNYKLNSHVTLGLGIEPRPQWWEASALTTMPSLHPNKLLWYYSSLLNQGQPSKILPGQVSVILAGLTIWIPVISNFEIVE